MLINTFNLMDKGQARELLTRCCAAHRWVDAVVESRPFKTFNALKGSADIHWEKMQEHDLLEAFSAHPQIGNVATLREKFANTKALASTEQSSVKHADDKTLELLAQSNQEYLEKFGFIFIVCATGKSALEMLNLLQQRLPNTKEQELNNASMEQHKITILRLQKLFADSASQKEN